MTDIPDLTALARNSVNALFEGERLTADRDEKVFTRIKSDLEQAFESGVEEAGKTSHNLRNGTILVLAIIVLVLSGLALATRFPSITLPFSKPVPVFQEGAPSWELTIQGDTNAQASADPVVVDAKPRMGTDYGFVGEVQYKDYLFIRTVSITTGTVKIIVYHWTKIGGWVYYAEQVS